MTDPCWVTRYVCGACHSLAAKCNGTSCMTALSYTVLYLVAIHPVQYTQPNNFVPFRLHCQVVLCPRLYNDSHPFHHSQRPRWIRLTLILEYVKLMSLELTHEFRQCQRRSGLVFVPSERAADFIVGQTKTADVDKTKKTILTRAIVTMFESVRLNEKKCH
jgi:hypothetical protein